jgi:hypothetical protein
MEAFPTLRLPNPVHRGLKPAACLLDIDHPDSPPEVKVAAISTVWFSGLSAIVTSSLDGITGPAVSLVIGH